MLCDRNGYLDGTVYEIVEIIGGRASPPEQRGIVLLPCPKETNISGLSLTKSDRGTYLLITEEDELWDGASAVLGIFVPQSSDINFVIEEIRIDFGELSGFAQDINVRCINRLMFEQLAENPDSYPNLTPEAMAFLSQYETTPFLCSDWVCVN
jgi:hypothetical protein